MADEADAGKVRRGLRPPPRIPVGSRDELTRVFAEWEEPLRLRAHRRFVPFSRKVIDTALDQAMADTLAMEPCSFDHPLRQVLERTRILLRSVERRRRREAKSTSPTGAPIDPVLRVPLEGPYADAVMKLRPRWREALIRALGGEPIARIAESQGTSAATLRVHLHRARSELRKMVGNGNGNGGVENGSTNGHPPAAFLGVLLPARLRSLLRATSDVAHVPGALVPIVVCSLFSSAPASTSGAAAIASRPLAVASVATAHASTQRILQSPRVESETAAAAFNTAPPVAVRPSGRRAADETPEDVQLTSTATAPGGHGAVVALGVGNTCRCPVLMRSLDGGATWTASDGPPQDAVQLVLPPDYPRDPRIFAGVDAYDATGAPYMAADFGAPWQQLAGLPPGHIAVSSAFDGADTRLFVSALTGVWSLRLGRPVPRLEIASLSASATDVAALATPPPGGAAVLAWAPTASVAGRSLPSTAQSAVFRCLVTGPCVAGATLPQMPGSLAAGNSSTVIAYIARLAYLSTDGGETFTQLPMPEDVASIASVGLVGPWSAPWAGVTLMTGVGEVVQFSVVHGAWTDVAGANFGRNFAAQLAAIDQSRVIAVLQGAGYRCTAVGSGVWLPRCPP